MSQPDERAGLPSASGGDRFYNCAGSVALEAQAPPEEPTDEAVQGQEIHDAKESDDFSDLDEQGRNIAEQLTVQENKALERWKADTGETDVTVIREERLWIKDRRNFKPVCSAKLDVLFIGARNALVQDFKTGYLRVTPAYRNTQARIQSIAVWHEYPRIERVRAGISAYRFTGSWDPVDYDRERLQDAERQLFYKLWETGEPDASRVPGPWCKYCRAKAFCPEAAAYSMVPVVPFAGQSMKKADLIAAVYQMDLTQLAFIRKRKSIVQNILDAVDERMKKFSPEELASVGWNLVPTGNMRTVPDIQKLWNAIHKLGLLTEEEFRACLKVVVGRIEEALVAKVVAATGGTQKAALAEVRKALEPAIELKPKAPTLKPIKDYQSLPE